MVLGIDLGSSSFKAAVVDATLKVRGYSSEALQYARAPDTIELDAEMAVAALTAAIRNAIQSAGISPSRLDAVGLTSQAQTFTIVSPNSRPRMPFISWQDNRAVAACAKLAAQPAMRDAGRHCSFSELLPALQVCQIKHLQMEKPGWIGDGDLIVNLPTFFVMKWTGTAAIDENLAAMSGLYSLQLKTWWPAALKSCGLIPSQLPVLKKTPAIAGVTNEAPAEFGLPKGLPVVLAGNDQTAGAFAAGLEKNGNLLMTLGTAYVAYGFKTRQPPNRAGTVRGPYPFGGYYQLAADPFGENLIAWARGVLANCGDEESFIEQAFKALPGCQGLKFEAEETGRCAWRNIGLHHTAADCARSVLEFLDSRIASMIETLDAGPIKKPLLAAGGGSRSSGRLDILSKSLGRKCSPTLAEPVIGAARMALQLHFPGSTRAPRVAIDTLADGIPQSVRP